MRLKFLIVLLVLPYCCFSQTKTDSLLIGSWKCTGYEMQNKFYPASGTIDQISFFLDHVYQQTYSRNADTSQSIYAGNWKISDDQTSIGFLNRHLIPNRKNIKMNDDWNEITSLSDSILILGGYEGKIRIYKTYRKTEIQNRIADEYTAPPVVAAQPVYRNAYLVNSAHPKKKIKVVSKNDGINFKYTTIPNDTSEYKTIITCSGSVKDINDSVIYITTYFMNYEQDFPGDSSVRSSVSFNDSNVVKAIPIRNITEISFLKNPRSGINSFGIFLATISTSTVFPVAPAAGIQFNPLRYNLRRYAIVSLCGLAGLTGGLIMTLASDYNYYTIIHQSSEAGKNAWYLQAGN